MAHSTFLLENGFLPQGWFHLPIHRTSNPVVYRASLPKSIISNFDNGTEEWIVNL